MKTSHLVIAGYMEPSFSAANTSHLYAERSLVSSESGTKARYSLSLSSFTILFRLGQVFLIGFVIFMLSACGGAGSSGRIPPPNNENEQGRNEKPPVRKPPIVTASKVDMNGFFPEGYYSTFSSNVYVAPGHRPGSYDLYLLNGLHQPTLAETSKFNYWTMLGSPMNFLPVYNISDDRRRQIVFSDTITESSVINAVAWASTSPKFSESGIIYSRWLRANGFGPDIYRQSRFYSVGDFAVVAWNAGGGSDLVFSKFVMPDSLGQPIWLTNQFMSTCAINSEDKISAIEPSTNLGNITDNNYVFVGTEKGGICIYGLPGAKNPGWKSLTAAAKQAGYIMADGVKMIKSVEVVNQNKNYNYWSTSDGKLWRVITNSQTNAPEEFNNIISKDFINSPIASNINPTTLFVDLKNNVYVGWGQDDKGITEVYVLPVGFKIWQTVKVANESRFVTSITLAVDGVTPIVGIFPETGLKNSIYYLKLNYESQIVH